MSLPYASIKPLLQSNITLTITRDYMPYRSVLGIDGYSPIIAIT
jgi:hypothetical protein